ncbi:MAG: hypothetical protein ACM3Y9_08320 [Ignavibacteria bacterium]
MCLLPCCALAYEIGERCDFGAEELVDPEKVVQLQLSGEKFCPSLISKEVLKDGEVHPSNALAKLPIDPESGEKASGIYREYRIIDRKDVRIEGMEAKEYTVQLLYTILIGYQHVNGAIGPYGLLPVCEVNNAKLYALHTPRGWYVAPSTNIGRSEYSAYGGTWKHTPPNLSQRIAEFKAVSARCKRRLK